VGELSRGPAEAISDKRALSMEVKQFRETLKSIEDHLRLRNFLVGYQMTLADVYLAVVAGQAVFACQAIMDKKTRDKEIPNVTRFATLVFEMIGQNPASLYSLT
jgi:glutathione S-transferase